MIDKNIIFTQLGMEEVEYQGTTYHKGPDGKFYWIETSDSHVMVYSADAIYEPKKKIFQLIRIYDDEDMNEISVLALKGYMETGDAWLKAYNDINLRKAFIRRTLGRKIGPRELENLCQYYYESVVYGSGAEDLTDTLKEVLKIHAMPPAEFAHPELHELLLKVPDTYFDFIQGVERNTERNPGLQERYIKFMKKYPKSTSSDIIILGSMLNADMTYKDEWLMDVITLANSDDTFAHYEVKHGTNEIVQFNNKHDWHIFVKYINGRGYTFRQVKSLVYVDYMDSAIRAAAVTKIGDDIGMVYDIAEKMSDHFGVYEALLNYLEQLVRESNYHNMVAYVKPMWVELYENLGYEVSEDVIIDNPYVLDEHRVFMWKKLEY